MSATPPENNKPAFALIAAMLALAMWSGTAIANKIAVEFMSGLSAGIVRSTLAGSFALVIALLFGMPLPTDKRDRLLLATSGIASFAIWPALLGIGIERTTAIHAAIIMAMIPIFTVLLQHCVERKAPNPRWWLGAIAAFAATSFLVIQQGSGEGSNSQGASATGDLIILAGCLICAAGYVAGGSVSRSIGGVAATFWGLAIALTVLLPMLIVLIPDIPWSEVPPRGWIAIGWMTILSSLTGYALWFFALAKGGTAKIGSLQLAMPVTTIAAAALILGEAISIEVAAITFVIIAGTVWAHRHAAS